MQGSYQQALAVPTTNPVTPNLERWQGVPLFNAIRKYRPGLPFPTSFIVVTLVLDLSRAGPCLESVTHSPAAFPGPVCFESTALHAQWETLSHTVPKRPRGIENRLTFIINAKSFPAASLSTVKGWLQSPLNP